MASKWALKLARGYACFKHEGRIGSIDVPALAEVFDRLAEREFRYGYRLGASRGSHEETEDEVVRLWKHVRDVEVLP